jgi:hypothetical protein
MSEKKTRKSPPGRTARLTEEIKESFLNAIKEGMLVEAAAKEVGYTGRWMMKIRHRDPDFDAAWTDATMTGRLVRADVVESEIHRRAIEGIPERVYYKGKLIYTATRYSDTLLMFYAKSLDERFRDRSTQELQHSGPGGAPLSVDVQINWVDPKIVKPDEATDDETTDSD